MNAGFQFMFLTFSVVRGLIGASDKFFSKDLTQYLLQQHVRYAPPDDIILLVLDIDLVQILAVDAVKQKLSVQVFMYEEWHDETLSWDPEKFGGILRTWIPVDRIWVSDVTILNTLEFVNVLETIRSPAEVYHTGHVVRSYPAVYSVACDICVEEFPLDVQSCELKIASWGYAKEKLVIRFNNRSSLEHYHNSEEWALKGVTAEELFVEHDGIIYSEARFRIEISRKPLHYVMNLVFPCYIICVLGVAGLFARFSTRQERQERFTLGVTALVSVAVYGTVVAEKIPHTSRKVPRIVMFFLFNLVTLSVATIAAGSVMLVDWRGSKADSRMPPEWLLKVLRCRNKIPPSHKHETRSCRLAVTEAWSAVARRLDTGLFCVFLCAITMPALEVMQRCAQKLSEPDSDRVLHIRPQ